MSAFIIAYDLNKQGQNYDCIIKKLEELGAWHMQQSVWILSSTSSASSIRDALGDCLDKNDRLFVGKITAGAWKGLGTDATNWLKAIITS